MRERDVEPMLTLGSELTACTLAGALHTRERINAAATASLTDASFAASMYALLHIPDASSVDAFKARYRCYDSIRFELGATTTQPFFLQECCDAHAMEDYKHTFIELNSGVLDGTGLAFHDPRAVNFMKDIFVMTPDGGAWYGSVPILTSTVFDVHINNREGKKVATLIGPQDTSPLAAIPRLYSNSTYLSPEIVRWALMDSVLHHSKMPVHGFALSWGKSNHITQVLKEMDFRHLHTTNPSMVPLPLGHKGRSLLNWEDPSTYRAFETALDNINTSRETLIIPARVEYLNDGRTSQHFNPHDDPQVDTLVSALRDYPKELYEAVDTLSKTSQDIFERARKQYTSGQSTMIDFAVASFLNLVGPSVYGFNPENLVLRQPLTLM